MGFTQETNSGLQRESPFCFVDPHIHPNVLLMQTSSLHSIYAYQLHQYNQLAVSMLLLISCLRHLTPSFAPFIFTTATRGPTIKHNYKS